MARSLIGLDVGTAAVRAAEVRLGRGKPQLLRFGQVALPPGAVVAGEVVDAPAVSAALRRLWKEAGFTDKRVVTGVAGPRVVARTTELPMMSDDDIRSSLPFQVQELIPIPLDEAVLDHQILESIVDADGTERLRVLVVAAHRDVLRSLLAALDGAGLEAKRVDLIPNALIRTLHDGDFADLGHGDGATAEVIVDIGGGVTNVVVHEHGVPRFVRTLSTGGVELTEAIVTDLDVAFDEAEALKRGSGIEVETRHARDVVRAALAPVVEEIHTSLDFWQAQSPDAHLRRVIVTGGGAASDDVPQRLQLALAMPIERARAFARFDVSKVGLDEDVLAAAEPFATVALGLALSAESLAGGSRRLNLVPGEIATLRRERRQVVLAGGAVALFAALLLAVVLLRNGKVDDANAEAVAAEARTTDLTQQVTALQEVETLETDLSARRQTVVSVLNGDVAWGTLIQQVSTALPDDVWLTNFSGTRGAVTGSGEVSFGAVGFDQTSTARWIQGVSELEELTAVWVLSSTKSEGGSRDLVQFSSSASLTPAASSTRVARYAGSAT